MDDAGRLTLRVPGSEPGFSFLWRGRRFAAVLGHGQVSVTSSIGQVPSTSRAAERREEAFAAVRALPRTLPAGWTMRLSPDHRLQLEAGEAMEWPANVASLMQPLVSLLLTLAPYLDLLDEVGLGSAPVSVRV